MNGFSTNQSCFIAFQKSVNLIETRNNFANNVEFLELNKPKRFTKTGSFAWIGIGQ